MRSEADEVRSVGWSYNYKRKYERISNQWLSLGLANGRSMAGEWSVMVGACRASIWYITLTEPDPKKQGLQVVLVWLSATYLAELHQRRRQHFRKSQEPVPVTAEGSTAVK